MDSKKRIKFITLHRFQNPFTAEVVKARLEAEGIKAYIIDNHTNYTIGPTLIQGSRLQVEQEHVLKANQILQETLAE